MPRTSRPARIQLWKDRLAAFKASGQTIAKFCQELPCSVNSFYAWKRRIETVQNAVELQSRKPLGFLPVVLRSASEPSVSIQLPTGVSIQVPCEAIDAIRVVLERVA